MFNKDKVISSEDNLINNRSQLHSDKVTDNNDQLPSDKVINVAIKLIGTFKVEHAQYTYDRSNRGEYHTAFNNSYKFSIQLPEKIFKYFSKDNKFQLFAENNLDERFNENCRRMVETRQSENIFIHSIGDWGSLENVNIDFSIAEINQIPDEFYDLYIKLVDHSSDIDKKRFVKQITEKYEEEIIMKN